MDKLIYSGLLKPSSLHVCMTCEGLKENVNKIITANEGTCVKQLLLSPFV